MIEILGTKYTSKKLKEIIKNMAKKFDVIQKFTPDELAFLTAIAERHARPEKIENAIRDNGNMRFSVTTDWYGSSHYKFMNIDGEMEAISLRDCCAIKPKKRSDRDNLNEACRLAFKSETEFMRRAAIGSKCPVTGEILDIKNTHIHHQGESDMATIIDGFLDETGLDISKIEYQNSHPKVFVDSSIETRFREYHNNVADLIAVSRTGHDILHEKGD